MSALTATCKTDFRAVHDSGTRDVKKIIWIVLHDTEGPVGRNAARNVAAYFAGGTAQASTHLVVDETDCYRCLPNNVIPWGAASAPWIRANTRGFHIEQCGWARWTSADWLIHETTLRRAAYKTALHCKLFGIPLRWVGPAGLVAGKAGITTHRDVSVASRLIGGHSDPGRNYPKSYFLELVCEYATA